MKIEVTNRKTRCLASLVILASLLISGNTIMVSADAPSAAITVDAGSTLSTGQSFQVIVSSDAIDDAYAVSVKVAFDQSTLEVVSVDWNTSIPYAAASSVSDANKNGFFANSYVDLSNGEKLDIPDKTVYLTATLKVREHPASKSAIVSLVDFKPYNDMAEAIPVSIQSSQIQLAINQDQNTQGSTASTALPTTGSQTQSSSESGSASSEENHDGQYKVTLLGTNHDVVSESYVNSGESAPTDAQGYQYKSVSAVSSDTELSPINVTDDGYVVVNTLAGKRQ